MSPRFPYTKWPTFSSGAPIRFIVGPAGKSKRFDIHHLLLGTHSRIFNVSDGVPRMINREIRLPNTDPEVFDVMCHWLYSKGGDQILEPTKEEQLQYLMELWVAYAELGLDYKMNAIMRSGMALMQPKQFKCPVETVEWVYKLTHPKSKLRGYIVAIFCQRAPEVTRELLLETSSEIFRDANEFLKVLYRVRMQNPQKNDKGETIYPLPNFLVWGDKWQTVPDEHFFVSAADEYQEGGEVLKQLKRMNHEI